MSVLTQGPSWQALGRIALAWRRRFDTARLGAAVAVATIIAAWALVRWPVILPGITVNKGGGGPRYARLDHRRRAGDAGRWDAGYELDLRTAGPSVDRPRRRSETQID